MFLNDTYLGNKPQNTVHKVKIYTNKTIKVENTIDNTE